jgi:hypothetical protein
MIKYICVLVLLIIPITVFSQDDLLVELENDVVIDSTVTSAFKGLKIVNFESTKLVANGDFYFVIAHRFGSIKDGIDEFFGLDTSSIRFSLIWGLNDWLNLGFSRSSFNKMYDLTAKYRLIEQKENGFPVTVVGFNSLGINSAIDEDQYSNFEFKQRVTYLMEALISRKVNEKLSLELVPAIFHENFVVNDSQENTQYAIGGGGRYKISKFVTLNLDYAYHLNRASNSSYNNPLSLGVDIETGGHVFQLVFSNAQPMYDTGYLTNAAGDWAKGDIFFGFNLSRVF